MLETFWPGPLLYIKFYWGTGPRSPEHIQVKTCSDYETLHQIPFLIQYYCYRQTTETPSASGICCESAFI